MLWHGLAHRHVLKIFLLSNMWPGSCKLLLTASLPPNMYILLPSDMIFDNSHLSPSMSPLDLYGEVPTPLHGTNDPWRSGSRQLFVLPLPFPFCTLLHWLIYLSVCSHCFLSPECLFILLCPALIRQDPHWDPQSTLLILSFSNDYTED